MAAANPLAAEAGASVLRDGGNAVDAAIATAFTLNVVEPHASGIGGGGFMLIYLADSNEVHVIDYRETAPSALTEDVYTRNGEPSSRGMIYDGKAIGTPGMTRGLLHSHDRFGKLSRQRLLEPAIRYAENGYEVSSVLAGHIEARLNRFKENPTGAAIFLNEDLSPLAEGTILKQPGLGSVLKRIAEEGETGVYNSKTAGAIAAEVRARGGVMTANDILSYEPQEREPITASYRGYDIVTIGPPSSGGLLVVQALSILDQFDLSIYTSESPEYLALLVKALEAAQKSTDEFVADPDFTDVPIAKLLSEDWRDNHVSKISQAISIDDNLAMAHDGMRTIPPTKEHVGNTTHLSVIDRNGNMVALTQTINYFFGSGVVIPELGIIMNNEISDFTVEKDSVNLPAPGKRPRSSISPVIVMKDGKPVAAIGSPGGRRIPAAMVQILVSCIDFNESIQDAIDAPRLYVDSTQTRVAYEPRYPAGAVEALSQILAQEKEWGFERRGEMDMYFGGAQGIWVRETETGPTIEGAADPRRNGAVTSSN